MSFLDLTGLTRFKGKIIDVINAKKAKSDEAIAIVCDNSTHVALSAGQYVYVKNHGTITEGLYTANSAKGANVALTTSDVTAVSNGGLNSLNSKIITQTDTVSVGANGIGVLGAASGNEIVTMCRSNSGNKERVCIPYRGSDDIWRIIVFNNAFEKLTTAESLSVTYCRINDNLTQVK